MATNAETKTVAIKPPKFERAVFTIQGVAPLVIHRFSQKAKNELAGKQSQGKASSSKKVREAQDPDEVCQSAKYISREGWEGFNASSIRKAMISACRLVDYKMVLARLSVFVEADGWDAKEPQIPLVRIYGQSVRQEDIARVSNGNPYVTIRPAYHDWKAKVTIRWDADQFTLNDVTNLLSRVGQQVGIGEGRPSSDSGGMGWGLFEIEKAA